MAQFDRIPLGAGLRMAFHPTLLTASLALNLFGVALPIFTLQIYDRVIPNSADDTLNLLVLLLVAVLVGEGLMRAARNVLAGWAGARFEHAVGCAAIARLLHGSYGAVLRETAGTQLERLGAVDRLRDFYANHGATIFVDLPFALLFAALIRVVGGPVVWVVAGVFVAFAIVALFVGALLRRAVAERTSSDDRRTSFMIETLTGITTIKALTMERQMMRRYERLMDRAAAGAHRVTDLSSLSQTLGTLFSNLAVVAVLGVGALRVLDGDMTVGQLACCSLLAGRTLQPLMRAMGIWTSYQSVRVARSRLADLAALPLEPAGQAGDSLRVTAGAVEMRGVSFGYEGGKPLLKDANLTIAAGECVALVAANGSGRSTVLSLLAGLLRPNAGTILYDGVALGAGRWRRAAGACGNRPIAAPRGRLSRAHHRQSNHVPARPHRRCGPRSFGASGARPICRGPAAGLRDRNRRRRNAAGRRAPARRHHPRFGRQAAYRAVRREQQRPRPRIEPAAAADAARLQGQLHHRAGQLSAVRAASGRPCGRTARRAVR
jgi:ATP-binding cassette subfamily C protein LapB